jgi:hypothetical protein
MQAPGTGHSFCDLRIAKEAIELEYLVADGPGDRWPSNRREESPDTIRATRLVTPGVCAARLRVAFTESATENRPPRKRAPVTGGRETCLSSCEIAFAGKGEKVG